MATTLYSNGIDQAIDSNGQPYPGARRHFYNNRTALHRTVWQDAEKQVEHENPVVADANGVFPPIHVEGVYSTRLETSAGALIPQAGATQDDVNATITDIITAQTSSSVTLSNVDYDESGSTGLNFAYSSGRVSNFDGSVTIIPAGALALQASQPTIYIYYDYSANAVVSSPSPTRNLSKLLFTASTDSGTITSVVNEKDAFTQLLYPVGEIKIYPIDTVPPGIRATPLDGLPRNVDAAPEFQGLYDYLGNSFGGTDHTDFIVPTYAGYFLRIWDNGAGIDPDAASRTDRGDGTTGDAPGTVQASSNMAATIPLPPNSSFLRTPYSGTAIGLDGNLRTDLVTQNLQLPGAAEARSINKYVYAVMTY